MNVRDDFHSLADLGDGLARRLADGVSTRVFVGDQAMLSIVDLEPGARSAVHSHDEEQWGVLLKGSGVRVQGGERVAVKAADFWRTPGGVPHAFEAGPEGARILDVFSPPREAYRSGGAGLG